MLPLLPSKSKKAILFYFTQNSVSKILFGVGVQRPDSASLTELLGLGSGWNWVPGFSGDLVTATASPPGPGAEMGEHSKLHMGTGHFS